MIGLIPSKTTLVAGAALACGMALVGLPMWGLMTINKANHREELALLRASVLEHGLKDVRDGNALARQAIELSEKQRKEAHEASTQLQSVLRGLRLDTLGMRDELAGLPAKFPRMERATLERYTSACTALLAAMGERGEAMARAGAEIANLAGGHFADDTMRKNAAGAPSAATSPKN